MSEPTKEAIFVTVGVSEDSWATVPKDGALTLDEAKCHALAQEFINGNVTQGTTTAMLVSAIIAHVRKKARDDALDEARELLAKPDWIRVEDALPVVQKAGTALWLHSLDCSIRNATFFIPFASAKLAAMQGITHWRYAEPTPQPPEGSK